MALSSKAKTKLIAVVIVSVIAAYSWFAWPRGFFPFTKENKEKINKVLKGSDGSTTKEEDDAEAQKSIEELLAQQEAELEGSVETPRGGTGALPIGQGGLGEPQIKGDEEISRIFEQELYRQLFLPFERSPNNLAGDTDKFQPILQGGDIPHGNTIGSGIAPFMDPAQCEEFFDIYGFYPPGGTCREQLGDFGHGICALCASGFEWDTCSCRCAPIGSPRAQCYRPECDCGNNGGQAFQARARNNIRAQMGSRLRTVSAKRARRAMEARGSVSRNEIQHAFSKLQYKAIKSRNLQDPPTSFLKLKGLRATLPPAVAKRHSATRLSIN